MKKEFFLLFIIIFSNVLFGYNERSYFYKQAMHDLERSDFFQNFTSEETREKALWDDKFEYKEGKLTFHSVYENQFAICYKFIYDTGFRETIYENNEKSYQSSEIIDSKGNYSMSKENYILGIQHGGYERKEIKPMASISPSSGEFNKRYRYMESYFELKGEYILGIKNGPWLRNEKGREYTKGEYFHGVRNGSWIVEWSNSKNSGNYVMGAKDGEWSEYSYDEMLKSKINYKFTLHHGYYEYRRDDLIEIGRYNAERKVGDWITYEIDGKPKWKTVYNNGKQIDSKSFIDGEWVDSK